MKHVRKGVPFLLPLCVLLAAFYFLTPISSEPSSISEIDALAPAEVIAEDFSEPTGLVVDQSGAVFVSDRKSGDIFKITQTEVHPAITDLKRPVGLAFDLQGRLLVVEEKTGRLLRLETNGSQTILTQGMKKPRWVAVAEDGTVYISAKGLKSVKDKDEDDEDEEHGEAILQLTTQGELTVFVDGFKGLQGVVVHENNLFAAAKGLKAEKEDSGAVFKIPILPDGGAGPVSKITKNKIKKPFGLVLDALGALYVSAEEIELTEKSKDAIGKIASDGALSHFASKLENPRGLALDSFGNLYVADDNDGKKGRIIRFRAPPPPTINIPAFTKQNPLTVAGTTEANSRIDAFLNDSSAPTTILTEDGSFSLTLNLTTNNQNLTTIFTAAHNGQGLTSAPAEFTILHDSIVPLISNLQPANGSFSSNPRPLIRADFSDNLSGVDVGKVEIRLDGFNVTAQASVTPSGFTLNLLNCLNILNCPLSEGHHSVSVTVFDRAGNSALASSTFTIDVTAPLIANLTPAHGSVVSTAFPLIQASFSDNFGINPVSVRIFLDGADVTSLATINSSGFTLDPSNPLALKLFPLSQGQHTVFVSLADLAGNPASASSTFTVSLGPQLNPIGNKLVNLGETLIFTVSATSPGAGVNLFVSPLPLPTNAAFNASTGLFTFTPNTIQVGSFQLIFSAVSGGQSVSETITVAVPQPPPGGQTALRGRVYNLNNTPLGNVKVTLKSSGHTAFSTNDGFFTISGVPSGKQELIINGREANLGVFAILAVPVDLIEGVLNNLPNIITIPDVDVAAEVQVSSVFTTIVSNLSVPGVELTIPGGTAKNSDGTAFTGKLSINPVPDYGRPESRPEELRPGMAITIQPAGVRFNPPARLTFPNADGMPVGSELNLWSLSPDTGTFNLVGKGVVSQDGLSIVTTEGGVSASAWHFFLASSPTPADSSTGNRYCASGNCPTGSEANLEEGSLFLSHTLPSYRALGQSRSLSLTYSSVTADPRPIISLNTTLSVRAAVPNTFSTKLEVGGVQQGGEIFTDTRSLPEDSDSTSRISAQFDASNLPTGRYPYSATIFSNYQNSSIGGITNGNVIVFNRKKSPFGSGWAVSDLQQLHIQADGSVLLTTGSGVALHFSGGPSMFTPPPGDFSILIRNADDTYTRTLKDGTKINFNAQGLQTSVVDRNGNSTAYSYNASGRLLTITDPAGLVMTLSYSGEKLQKITDPAGRETLFQHDAPGNLIKITNPDGTFVAYTYDAKGHATQATDERGNATTYAYDFAGRFSQSTKPNGETRALTSSKLQGLADVSGGQGTPINPAPVVQSQNATSSITDGKGNQTTFTLNSLGQISSQTDALGNTTLIERDSNGNPTKITRPNGAVLTMGYDARANLLTSTDPVGATTIFTYEPSFNQVTSIRDPKGGTTTISYDLRGNPTEIIDALNDRTQMVYTSQGLLALVTSAVGTPQQNTTSFSYDTRGNLFTTTDPKTNVTTLAYDNAGNVTRSTDSEGRVTEFTYDLFNRLISAIDHQGKITSYAYDPKGNLTQVIDSRNQLTTFNYDALDRLISASNSLGFSETFIYDENGNLTSTTARNSQLISFDYDALNRLIKKTRPPTSTEIGSQSTTFQYDSVGNLVAAINPTIGVFNQYDLANRLVSSFSGTEAAVSGVAVQINADTTIGENNFEFDGRTLQVNGRTLTVDGTHTFANLILTGGARLTHNPTTATKVNKLDIRVTGTLTIDATSRIDVTGRGFLGGGRPGGFPEGPGMTVGFQRGSISGSGGSYGGLGGIPSSGPVNPVYGDFRDPNEVGSGGSGLASPGGNGGGLIRIVAQTLQLDGSIVANGENGLPGGAGGGASGGGIRVDVGTLRGTGGISANGGNGAAGGGGGGGGGRVAIYYQSLVGFDLGKVTTFGGTGANAVSHGGAGTVYLQGPGRESGELIADNNNSASATQSTPVLSTPAKLLALTHLRVKRGAKARVDDPISLSSTLEVSFGAELIPVNRIIASAIDVNNSSVVTQQLTTGSAFFKVDVSANSLTVDATSRIDVTGRGFLGGGKPGGFPEGFGMTVGFQRGSFGQSGGSYGGLGGVVSASVNPVYGDFRDPNDIGSGGGGQAAPGGNGGGLIRIVAQTLQLDGVIVANGEDALAGGSGGGGSGGGIRIDVGTLRGAGSISAAGGRGGPGGGAGGGGGRVAVYYQSLVGFDPNTQVSAFGGLRSGSAPNGGAGTIYLQGPGRESGELIVDNNNLSVSALSTPIPPEPSGLVTLTNLRVKRGARVRVDDQMNLTSFLEVSSGAEFVLVKRVIAATINVTSSSAITHLFTTAAAFFNVNLSANALTVDVTSRIDVSGRGFLGGGKPGGFPEGFGMTVGFQRGSLGQNGGSYGGLGGAVSASVNPVYGDFRDPNDVGSGGGGLAAPGGNGGGLVRIVAQTLQLDGLIVANGENGVLGGAGGGGSGGGVRIDVGTLRGTGTISANGGNGAGGGGAGGGGGRVAVYYQSLVGFDLAKVIAFGGSGITNGGAGTAYLQGPGRESGELIVDNNNLAAQFTPIASSPSNLVSPSSLRLQRASAIADGSNSFFNAVLANNALLTHNSTTATTTGRLELKITGTLTVDVTSRVNVTARGFLGGGKPGGFPEGAGMTLGFQRGSIGSNGGSYGGLGGFVSGTLNPVYGDFRDPNDVGSGGGGLAAPGGNGGGLVRIVAQTLQLDGLIVANGENGVLGGAGGGGSGGGVRIDVGTLRGTGTISANGGNGAGGGGAGGGGGRVAIYHQDATGFNLSSQVSVSGGTGVANGQPGTVFTQQQTFIGRGPMEYNAPVMLALPSTRAQAEGSLVERLALSEAGPELNRRVEGTTQNETLQLASLGVAPVGLKADAGAVRIPDFKELIAKIHADVPQVPQRRIYEPVPVAADGKQENLYLALAAEKGSPEADFDPIYTYDLNGNRTSMIDPTGITSYTYDALNRLTSVTNNRGLTTSFTYDSLGRRTSMTHGNGVVSTYAYDAASQLTRLAHQLGAATINSFDYSYDRVGNRKSKTSRDGVHNYTYDTLNRLTEAINPLPSNPLESFTYDAVGNRTTSNQNGASVFNVANQLEEDANFRYVYDANGNLTRKTNKTTGELTQFEYTAENQLVRVVRNGTTINYRYDGLGRRVEKEVNDGATTNVTRYILDQEDVLLELDGSNNIVARYTHGPGVDEPLIMEKGGASFFYHADGLGSITEITDTAGVVKQRYTYSSFGKIESQFDPNFVQPYTFTAREFDPETGLYFYRARYYDLSTGRFLQEDLLGGALLDPSTQNRYPYVGNRPLNFIDPSGHLAVNIALGIIGVAISAGYDVIQGRPIDWGDAIASGLSYSLVGGGPVMQAFISAGIALVRSSIKELTDCKPEFRVRKVLKDALVEGLTSRFAPSVPHFPWDKLGTVRNAYNNAYLYNLWHQRLFNTQFNSVVYETLSQGLDRGIDRALGYD